MLDEFDIAEKKGRYIVERLISGHCVNYEFTEKGNPIDLYATGFTKNAAIEIKLRENYNANDVENFGGMYIKETKYKSLTGTTLNGYTPFFFVIFKDWIYVWDITKVNLKFQDEYLDNTCVVDTGKSYQSISYLHLDDAIKRYRTEDYR